MSRSSQLIGLAALAWICASAEGQEALAAGGPYKLVSVDPQGSLVLSGMKNGAEPESIEAWIWTIYSEPKADPVQKDGGGETHDSLAQKAVVRCTGRSIEVIGAEYYVDGAGWSAPYEEQLPQTPRAGAPMEMVWKMACEAGIRFSARNFTSLAEINSEIRMRLGGASSAAVQSSSRQPP